MGANLIIGIVVVVAISGVVLILLRILAESTRRFRVRLFEQGEAALDDGSFDEHQKIAIERMLELSDVPAGGWFIISVYAEAAFGRRDRAGEATQGGQDERMVRITTDFAVSALGANPVALVLTVPLILALALREHMAVRRAMQAGASRVIPDAICHA